MFIFNTSINYSAVSLDRRNTWKENIERKEISLNSTSCSSDGWKEAYDTMLSLLCQQEMLDFLNENSDFSEKVIITCNF